MKRVERHIIVGSQEFDEIALKSKNLYNRANYEVRQRFIGTSKEVEKGDREHAEWLRYNELDKLCKQEEWPEYRALPAQTAQQILKLLEKNWKSFFSAIKVWSTKKEDFTGRPKLPGYIRNGKNIVIFTNQQVKLKNDGHIHFPEKSDLNPLKTKVQGRIQQVRIIPRYTCYIIEVVYEIDPKINENLDNDLYIGIDLGLNNLAAISSNTNLPPILINGRPLKSINQYFNKKKAEFMSFIGGKGTSNRIERLTHKRNQKINDYMHKTSRLIVDYANQHNIGNIVIGKNEDWKRNIEIGKRNNQNFVNIPFDKLIQQIEYKAEEVGIKVICHEESYTSKCSFLDGEPIEKHEMYLGKRVKRGLFKSSTGKLINADVNGSGNIIRKVALKAFADGVEALGLTPLRIQFS